MKNNSERSKKGGLEYMISSLGDRNSNIVWYDGSGDEQKIILAEEGWRKEDVVNISNHRIEGWKEKFEKKERTDFPTDQAVAKKKGVIVQLSERLLENWTFFMAFFEVLRVLAGKIIFWSDKEFKTEGVEFKRLLLHFPDMCRHVVHVDLEGYFDMLWEQYFDALPPVETEKILRKLNSIYPVNSVLLEKFVRYMKNCSRMEQRIPDEEMLQQFFRVESWKKKLDRLVSCDEAKEKVRELIMQQMYLYALKKSGKNNDYMGIRLVVSGNPGVGKSTLLQIIAEAFREEGIIKKGAELVSARELISDHVGGSEKRLAQIVDRCDLLIIDEIGGLTIGDKFDEGLIQMLVFLSESRRDIHLVFTGYDKDIRAFFGRNKGLRSRIRNFIQIKDYDEQDLVEIGIQKLKDFHYEFEEVNIREVLTEFVKRLKAIPDFGNARAVQNLMEHLTGIKAVEYEESGSLNMVVSQQQLRQAVDRYFENQPGEDMRKLIGFMAS